MFVLGNPIWFRIEISSEGELENRVCDIDVYDNLTYIIDIASLPASLFSTPVKLSTFPIEFPFTTSINEFILLEMREINL
jgi:hypothetical protein